MRGLIYKDLRSTLKRFKLSSRIVILGLSVFAIIFLRESGAIFLSILLPIGLASIPSGLLIKEHENGWNKYVALLPISKEKIIISRYIFCLGSTIGVGAVCTVINLITFFCFREFPLSIHILIPLIGIVVAILYLILLLPAVYAFDTLGNSIVSMTMLISIPAFVYALQKTSFGEQFIIFLRDANIVLLSSEILLVILLLAALSAYSSIKIYGSYFNK